VASTGAIVKSAAAIVAVVGVSAVAVDQGHLFGKDRSVDDGSRPAVTVAGRESAASRSHDTARTGEIQPGAHRGSRSIRAYMQGRATTEVGLKAPEVDATKSVSPPSSGDGAAPSAARAGARSHAGDSQSQTHPRHPVHPPHPAHPAHPVHPIHPSHPAHPAHPVHPAQTEAGGGSSKSTPSPSPKAQKPTRSAVPVKAPPEHPEHQSPPATEAGPTPTEAAPEAELPAAAAAPVEAEAAPVEAAPGLEGKETGR
jgi:hypothetical protein